MSVFSLVSAAGLFCCWSSPQGLAPVLHGPVVGAGLLGKSIQQHSRHLGGAISENNNNNRIHTGTH